jgi:hypothetical protein
MPCQFPVCVTEHVQPAWSLIYSQTTLTRILHNTSRQQLIGWALHAARCIHAASAIRGEARCLGCHILAHGWYAIAAAARPIIIHVHACLTPTPAAAGDMQPTAL